MQQQQQKKKGGFKYEEKAICSLLGGYQAALRYTRFMY